MVFEQRRGEEAEMGGTGQRGRQPAFAINQWRLQRQLSGLGLAAASFLVPDGFLEVLPAKKEIHVRNQPSEAPPPRRIFHVLAIDQGGVPV